MKEKALETQKSNRINSIILLILTVVVDIFLFKYYTTVKIDTIRDMPESNLLYYLLPLEVCFLATFILILLIINFSTNIEEIRNTDYSNDYCFGVKIKIRSFNDLYLNNRIHSLYIWYVDDDDGNVIAYRYTLDGTKYEGSMTIKLAKKLFKHPLLNYL